MWVGLDRTATLEHVCLNAQTEFWKPMHQARVDASVGLESKVAAACRRLRSYRERTRQHVSAFG